MKYLLLLLIISILIPLKSISQVSKTDTTVTCIPNAQLKQAIFLIEEGKITKQELTLTKEIIKIMEYQVSNKDSLIAQLTRKTLDWKTLNTKNEEIIINYQKQINNQEQMLQIEGSQSKKYKKQRVLFSIIAASVAFLITSI